MGTNRRNILKISASAIASALVSRRILFAEERTVRPDRTLRILILGGTGFTGPHQVRYALSRGHKVTLFNRGKQSQKWPGAVEELLGDRNVGDVKALEGRNWDVCIDNPTTLPIWVRDVGKVLQGRVKQYVFISTISAYADNATPADESAALASYSGKDAMAETMDSLHASGGELYGPLKAISEKEAEKQFPGITTIIRPGLIVGPGDESDRFTYWPVRLARGGQTLAPGDGSDPVQLIDARDLAEWTIRMAETRTFGRFNAVGPSGAMTMRQLLTSVAAGIRVDPHLIWVSTAFLESQGVAPWSDLPVWIPGQGDTAGFARRRNDLAIASGLTFRPISLTSADTLVWFNQQPAERQEKLKAGLSAEREAALLSKWKQTQSGKS